MNFKSKQSHRNFRLHCRFSSARAHIHTFRSVKIRFQSTHGFFLFLSHTLLVSSACPFSEENPGSESNSEKVKSETKISGRCHLLSRLARCLVCTQFRTPAAVSESQGKDTRTRENARIFRERECPLDSTFF